MRYLFPVILIGVGLVALGSLLFSPYSMEAGGPPPSALPEPEPEPAPFPEPVVVVDEGEARSATGGSVGPEDGVAAPFDPHVDFSVAMPEPIILEPMIAPVPIDEGCTGAALNDPVCDPVGAALEALKTGDLAYNRVTEMIRGEPVTLSLALTPDAGTGSPAPAAALTGLAGEITSGETRVSRKMEAALSGAGFKIDPPGPQVKQVFPGVVTRWDWTVTPERAGDARPLTLDVHAIVALDDSEVANVPVQTFRDVISVRVTVMDRLREAAADSKVLTALGGAAAMLWGGIEFFRRRKWRIEEEE